MLRIDGCVCDGHMRCAKRSSAALRTALTLESAANEHEIEGRDLLPENHLPSDLRPVTVVAAMAPKKSLSKTDMASDVAKLRRDIKNCFEQHACATACGDVPLVHIDVLGRAVRVFGNWHTLCAFCGALTRVGSGSRFRGEPCCMRCDVTMLYGRERHGEMIAAVPRPDPPKCRFCGKPETPNAATKWKTVLAPEDSGGRNADVPPPLRVCSYCPAHYRPWLPDAHKTLSTKIILSHISARAKPVYGAGENKRHFEEHEEPTPEPEKPKRSKRGPRKTYERKIRGKNKH